MELNSLQLLDNYLSKGEQAAIYLVVAKEENERKAAVKRLLTTLLKEEDSALGLKTFDNQELSPVLEELNTFNLLAERRVILVHNVETVQKGLEKYFSNPADSTYLVMDSASLAKNTKLYREAAKHGVVIHLAAEKTWEKEARLAPWITEQAKLSGKTISQTAANHIVKQTGVDSELILREIEKLVCYIGERTEITADDVAAISVHTPISSIWQLGDAIFQRNKAEAIRILRALIDDGATVYSLLPQIRRQCQNGLHISSLLASGGSQYDVAKAFPYLKGNMLNRQIRSAQAYGMSGFRRGLQLLHDTDLLSKNSTTDQFFLLEMLVVKLTIGA
jgi:DNA polymerase-3 subunit delta